MGYQTGAQVAGAGSTEGAGETARRLAHAPRARVAHLPTPLEPLDRLSATLGNPGLRLWVKRDDCTGLATGGNKTRKLEYLVGDALEQGADTLVTAGAIQSNHARQTAAVAARHGLRCTLLLTDSVAGRSPAYHETGNLLLAKLLGADIRVLPGDEDSAAAMEQVAGELRRRGRRPYVIPIGGSNGLGTLGYVTAFSELAAQFAVLGEGINAIVLATGSGGTQAGLLLGAALAGWRGEIVGISVGRCSEQARERVQSVLDAAATLLNVPQATVRQLPVVVDDGFTGPGYGQPGPDCAAAIRLAAETQGLLLDPVYTGKGMAGLLARAHAGRFGPGVRNVVFLHTGGAAALSAYTDAFEGARA